MIRKFKKFTKLSSEEKKLFFEAYVTLGVMHSAILTISFKRLTRSLEHRPNINTIIALNENEIQTAKMVGQAIMRASVYTPWESACLVQSLTAQKMLKKRGIPGVFYLGAMKDEEKMKAHSWSQSGDTIITGSEGHEKFKILSTFSWEK